VATLAQVHAKAKAAASTWTECGGEEQKMEKNWCINEEEDE
jgi:hypothetical protein